jgi:hypothetical protein
MISVNWIFLWKLFAFGGFIGQGVELAGWAMGVQLLLMIFGSMHQVP